MSENMPHRHHRRARTLSLLSISSGFSDKSTFDISKVNTAMVLCGSPETDNANGSFVPNASAVMYLQNLVSPQRRNRHFLREKRNSLSYDGASGSPLPGVPYITRTISFPVPTSSSTPSLYSESSDDRAPARCRTVLAQLERDSKFCKARARCSTCKKPGSDYPRCAKCGEMWCSRDCRLVGGKRHICTGPRIR